MSDTGDKRADLAGPGVSTYEEVEKILPNGYQSILNPKETQIALGALKRYIEDNLCKELNLIHIEVPLIVTKESAVNDYLDRDRFAHADRLPLRAGARESAWSASRPGGHQVEAHGPEAVQLRRGRGISPTCARCARTTSSTTTTPRTWTSGTGEAHHRRHAQSRLPQGTVRKIWKVITGAEDMVQGMFPGSRTRASRTCRRSSSSCTPRRSSRLPGPAAQAAGDQGHLRALPGDLHHRIGWVLKDGYRTRCAPPTTTTGARRSRQRQAVPRPER